MSEADQLLAALDAAPDDTARQALLVGCPRDLLGQVHASVAYRTFRAETDQHSAAESAAFASFTTALNSAPDDAARLKLIETARRERGAAFLAEWSWRRTASAADWMARCLALCREGAP
jgi:hypothetical protein